jgi:hypothetical protein
MAECATELRDSVTTVDSCPANDETIMFIGTSSYVRRTWAKLIVCIIEAFREQALPDDIDVVIAGDWVGRNYYEMPSLQGKRFRLFRDGMLLNSQQWRRLTAGGWELLTPGDQLGIDQVFTIAFY